MSGELRRATARAASGTVESECGPRKLTFFVSPRIYPADSRDLPCMRVPRVHAASLQHLAALVATQRGRRENPEPPHRAEENSI